MGTQNEHQHALIETSFDALLTETRSYLDEANHQHLRAAYEFGCHAHHGQCRESGVPYFTHPIAVATLLAELHLDPDTLITALLHDIVEDCHISLAEISRHFGPNIASLVDGVTKLTQIQLNSVDTQQAENFRKFIISVGKDIRVLLVKLADRTHNMMTIAAISDTDRQRRIATETMEIYAPLAERMGITRFQTEMENSGFAILQPELHASITTRLDAMALENENIVPQICQDLSQLLTGEGIMCDVSGRRKSPYSISRKMQVKNITMDQLPDVMAFRIIVPDIPCCYRTLGIVHGTFPVVMGRFKDYISTPKANGYQSLHTGVIGPLKQKIEVQIRTHAMDNMAEHGVAVHWHFKASQQNATSSPATPPRSNLTQQKPESFRWARELISLMEISDEPTEFLENTKLEMYKDQVFCFTPKGDLIGLPKGATPIDFAYAVHTDVGDKCVGVLINDKRRQLTTELVNGDQVDIMTDRAAQPKSEWEDYVITGRAKSAIKRYIRLKRQEEFASVGKALLEREYRFHKTNLKEKEIKPALSAFNVASMEELYVQIAESRVKTRDVFERLHPEHAKASKTRRGSKTTPKTEPVFSCR